MSGRADRSWINLGGEGKHGRVGPKLIPKRREEIHELEDFDGTSGLLEEVEEYGKNNEEDKVGEKSNYLHSRASVMLVVDEEGCHVVPY